MFLLFAKRRRAQAVAYSMGQLIHMLSTAIETMGPRSSEKLLRGLGTRLNEETTSDVRMLKAIVPMTSDQTVCVTLQTTPDDRQVLMIEGCDDYQGFLLNCGLPPRAVVIDLQPGFRRPITKHARLLYAQCKTMPNAIEAQDFR